MRLILPRLVTDTCILRRCRFGSQNLCVTWLQTSPRTALPIESGVKLVQTNSGCGTVGHPPTTSDIS